MTGRGGVIVHKLQPDGTEVFRWSGSVLERGSNGLVIVARFNASSGTRVGDIVLERGDLFIEFYYFNRWHNVYQIYSAAGVFKGWYCNVSAPVEPPCDSEVRYTDLVLDVVVHPGGDYLVLDEDEFDGVVPTYAPVLAEGARAGLRELIALAERRALPGRDFKTAMAALESDAEAQESSAPAAVDEAPRGQVGNRPAHAEGPPARPRVYVTRRIPETAIQLLERTADVQMWSEDSPVPRQELLRQLARADGLLCLLTERVDAELLAAAPRLRVVANMAVGYDNVDVAACTARGVVVANTPGVLAETTADFAFALLLAAARRVVESDRYVREGRWQTWGPLLFLGQDVHHATLGIVGMGRIGAEMAKRARGFDMRVLYHSRSRKPDLERSLGVEPADMDVLLQASDFVSLHVDLNPSTRRLISSPQLKLMRPSAVLINTARGPVVDPRALFEALRDGLIGGAALDVTDPEPIPPDDPLLSLPNVVVCPHVASASVATRARMAGLAAENLVAVLEGRKPPTAVNEVGHAS